MDRHHVPFHDLGAANTEIVVLRRRFISLGKVWGHKFAMLARETKALSQELARARKELDAVRLQLARAKSTKRRKRNVQK